ncbi:hypothetical protein [Candidatus Manganitrophus noduliformans]|uniref:Uncharacterized protein n=1 Tax=Candidatus Manganitrophus noduliformans TaxID=2606439 RepID=A0A7X6ID44_9BACT|nr:hypothetical protein [Candidatus Manganitrophus noduliformans]NKE73511.1 hypothetical protein [Candidatus Manganitrophus noduliformans]
MIQIHKVKILLLAAILAGLLSTDLSAHEVVGEVTPLMIHMKRVLLLIENGKEKESIREIRAVYEDFSHDMGMGMSMQGTGLKNTADQIDLRFGTRLKVSLEEALKKEDAPALQKAIQEIAFLLMLEKFEALRSTFDKKTANQEAQETIFWLGRNYFSYLLEPALASKNPVEEQRLDRLLDRMLYRLEDGKFDEFAALQKELVTGVQTAFHLDLPSMTPARDGSGQFVR